MEEFTCSVPDLFQQATPVCQVQEEESCEAIVYSIMPRNSTRALRVTEGEPTTTLDQLFSLLGVSNVDELQCKSGVNVTATDGATIVVAPVDAPPINYNPVLFFVIGGILFVIFLVFKERKEVADREKQERKEVADREKQERKEVADREERERKEVADREERDNDRAERMKMVDAILAHLKEDKTVNGPELVSAIMRNVDVENTKVLSVPSSVGSESVSIDKDKEV